jgi:predicted outer membrane repeat protein
MAVRNRRFTLTAAALPFLFLVMAGSARAVVNPIVVDTLDGFSETVPGPCSLTDAVAAANVGGTVNNCVGEPGVNEIEFSVTGTINLIDTLVVTTTSALSIDGPAIGGITLSGRAATEILQTGFDTNVTVTKLTFTEGAAGLGDGGAIEALGTSLTIENSTFTENQAEFGGAIVADDGTVTITNSTFYKNTAEDSGGAIYNDDATLLLTNDTFDANTATTGSGGSLYSANPVSKYKSTLFANGSPKNCAAAAGADHKDIGFNISDDNSCAFSMSTSKVESPGLASGLAQNGGPTETIALVAGANAIGHDTDCTDQSGNTVVTDQRLFARPDSPAKCDSGAYEFDAVAPLVLVPNSERLQIVHSSSGAADTINTAFSFIDNGPGSPGPGCDSGNNALNGLEVFIEEGSCSALPDNFLFADLSFVVNVVNHQSYGTSFGPLDQGGTESARIVQLPTPAGACGEWTLNLELSGLDLADLNLSGTGPFALVLTDDDGNQGCFNITNAIVGGVIDPPKSTVRRGVRK